MLTHESTKNFAGKLPDLIAELNSAIVLLEILQFYLTFEDMPSPQYVEAQVSSFLRSIEATLEEFR